MKVPSDNRDMRQHRGVKNALMRETSLNATQADERHLAKRFGEKPSVDPNIDYGEFQGGKLAEEANEASESGRKPVQLSRDTDKRAIPPSKDSLAQRLRKKEEEKTVLVDRQFRPEFATNKEDEKPIPKQETPTPPPPQFKPRVNRPEPTPEPVVEAPKATFREEVFSTVKPVKGEIPEGWTRQGLPSHCVPYSFDEIYVRTLEVPDLLSIYGSAQNNSYTLFLDALNRACSEDIRELTGDDLKFLMYWWRLNSFTKSPFSMSWTSRYGNQNRTMIANETDLEIVELKMTKDEFKHFKDLGLDFPRVRDAEYIDDLQLEPTERWLAERAQYVHCEDTGDDWYRARFEKLKGPNGIQLLEHIRDFSKKISHGVVERVKVKDKNFDPETAIIKLRERATYFSRLSMVESNQATVAKYNQDIVDYLDEADSLESSLEQLAELQIVLSELQAEKQDKPVVEGESPADSPPIADDGPNIESIKQDIADIKRSLAPREEVVALRISAMDFFPEI